VADHRDGLLTSQGYSSTEGLQQRLQMPVIKAKPVFKTRSAVIDEQKWIALLQAMMKVKVVYDLG
jgi:hypothetical protein